MTMYYEDLEAAGPLNPDIAEQLCWKTNEYSSKIVLTVAGRRILAQTLPLCWNELKVRRGTAISITVDGGHQSPDEDKRALRDFSELFRTLTAG
ncbi:hypothetical protein [Antrihabitans cavernicola]|uniref:Uncharacterized protein n=1 Tax=Antrihabitans cavernicola TaxID=2495913 RepID=A0A5A7S823_9NOCA|nr:hypothetical protein [Spelaeibacter cavernicola]KAA0022290.1 hypothetical protein FOY51_15050 [Spelaeibacter cavernicola]